MMCNHIVWLIIINEHLLPLLKPLAVLEATHKSEEPVSIINSICSFLDPNYICIRYSTWWISWIGSTIVTWRCTVKWCKAIDVNGKRNINIKNEIIWI